MRVGALMDEIDDLNDEEDRLFDDMPEPGEATAEDVEEVARRISERLREAPKDKGLKKAKRLVEKESATSSRRMRYREEEGRLPGTYRIDALSQLVEPACFSI